MNKSINVIYKIYLNGKTLTPAQKKSITSIETEELCDGSDTLTLSVSDPDYTYINSNIYKEEATIKVEEYLEGDTFKYTFDGYISAIDISFPEDGIPQLSIFCLDKSHKMNRQKKSRSWDNVTRPDVVKKIAAEYGYSYKIEPNYTFTKEDTISQSNTTDIEFLEGLADEETYPFMCKLIDKTIYYVRKGKLGTSVATLNYRVGDHSLLSFSPKINKETKQVSNSSSDINTNNKSVDKGTSSGGTAGNSKSKTDTTKKTKEPSYKYDAKTGKWTYK